MPTVELRDIRTDEDWEATMGLRLAPGQDRFVSLPADIRAEAVVDARAMPHPWSIHDAATGELVGIAMISDNIPEPMDPDIVGPYFLWKLLIDVDRQRHGYGTATLDAIVAYVRGRPNARELIVSCGEGDGSPCPFYVRYGFRRIGMAPWGNEVLLTLPL